MFFMQVSTSTYTIDARANAVFLVDQFVDYACASNGSGQYCAVAELMENFTDVCTEI